MTIAYDLEKELRLHEQSLAPYATRSSESRGRALDEGECENRSEFQRDRDRVIHSKAFRRLEYKTQVFINHEGDLYRTRLTHSIEVAQIARSISRALGLNEDLTEAIALAHDLGHTAFGHAGQDALNICMRNYGGFEHNLQSLRVVDTLEEKYAQFDGLNLTFETREGILKHCSLKNARSMGLVGERFIQRTQPGLEAQLTNIADEIAYNNHDVDDGLRSGLITIEQLRQVEIFEHQFQQVAEKYPLLNPKRQSNEVIRRIINQLIQDLLQTTRANLSENNIRSAAEVKAMQTMLAAFSPDTKRQNAALKSFLHKNLYQHERVQEMSASAQTVITELFETFFNQPDQLPEKHLRLAQLMREKEGDFGLARVVADYIAGMTDRYALSQHQQLKMS
ncbi:MAG: deoxyguanosinetriphosphate triphosphohydrolase [Gammaproteobacteria bacterium]|nr:deoxyguanosinetriphosphate triphosphohydrolase [Gammaproteobacteria bacterium]